jgi:hypothetical protein
MDRLPPLNRGAQTRQNRLLMQHILMQQVDNTSELLHDAIAHPKGMCIAFHYAPATLLNAVPPLNTTTAGGGGSRMEEASDNSASAAMQE